MKTRIAALSLGAATSLLVVCKPAHAASPTTPECLAASDAFITAANQHKLRAERSQLLICVSPSCPAQVRNDCERHIDEVNAHIPTIAFSAKDATSGADVTAVKVTMDGEILANQLDGMALSVDPGEHTFSFETAGQATVTKKLLIVEGQKDRHEVVTFGTPPPPQETPLPKETPPTPQPRASPSVMPVASPPVQVSGESGGGIGTQKVLAIVAGGLGVVGLGIGTAFGLMAVSKKNDAQNACPNLCATQDGVKQWSDASTAANISTVGFIVGGVGVAGAAVLWFTAPTSSGGAQAQVGFGPGILQLKGTW